MRLRVERSSVFHVRMARMYASFFFSWNTAPLQPSTHSVWPSLSCIGGSMLFADLMSTFHPCLRGSHETLPRMLGVFEGGKLNLADAHVMLC